jgi:hypothetical protein
MSDAVSFVVAIPYAADRLFVGASPDDEAANSPYSVWYTFVGTDESEPWTHYVNRWWPVAATKFVQPANEGGDWALVGLSDGGDVDFNFGDDPVVEKIPGAGIHSTDSEGWGYMSCLRQVGQHLYAAGGAGQVYKRLGPNQWVHMDAGLLQTRDVSERLLPRAIAGPHEAAIYLVGSISASGQPPFVCFWNGQHWTHLPLPEVAERLTGIHVESEQRIWLCGANGTLLLGNATDGFTSLSTVHDNQLFLSLCRFQGQVYLGSNLGLFVYDPARPGAGIRKVVTGLTPELQDANVVDCAEDVLWSIGPKDIARFDGQRWERIHHPDNPPIR